MEAFGASVALTWALVPALAFIVARQQGRSLLTASLAALFGIAGLLFVVLWPAAPKQRKPRAAPAVKYVPRHTAAGIRSRNASRA
jgi:hypothetical protein